MQTFANRLTIGRFKLINQKQSRIYCRTQRNRLSEPIIISGSPTILLSNFKTLTLETPALWPLSASPRSPIFIGSTMSSRSTSRTLYVGNLPGDVREREVEDLFFKYGRIAHIDLKVPPRPPGYAFVEFEDSRDAEDALRGRDGYDFDGHRLRVELAHGGRGHSSSSDRQSNYSGGRGGRGMSKRSDYRVLVSELPPSASWQDLKDHMRRAGDVCFSQVFRDGSGTTGIVDYTNLEDMKYAIKKLDGSEFRNAFDRQSVRVREYDAKRDSSRSPSRGRSRSKGRSYSRSRSPSYSRDRSRSKSPKTKSSRRSPARSRSRSASLPGSRSRSRSRSKSPVPSKRISKSPKKHLSKSPKKRSASRSPIRSRSRSRSKSLSRYHSQALHLLLLVSSVSRHLFLLLTHFPRIAIAL
ncbi:hypothetical protein ACFX19_008334 [Malus domestica]